MINHVVNQRYEVLEKVGDSPLFAVYKARDRTQNRSVVLKAVAPDFRTDEPFLAGLKTGLSGVSGLNQPGIALFTDSGSEDDTPFVIGEWVRGVNLKERIRRIAPFTLSAAIDIACALAESLQYAHALGQTHGDLRPHNVMVSPEGAVKLTDFGVASAIARSPRAQREILLRAAPYHAPELSMNQPGSPSGDIYALGSVLYEMLTGAPLYSGDTPEAVADQHAFAPVPSPRALNPGVPRSIEGITLKCLQKRPEARYRSMTDLLTDLKAVRDALRFGKPLSWSPLDNEVPIAPATPLQSVAGAARTSLEPVAEAAASSVALPISNAALPVPNAMPANTSNRLRARDERVSIGIKVAIGIMSALILVCIAAFAAIYTSAWVVPKSVAVPEMIGQPIDVARQLAAKQKLRLIEHPEYSDRARNIVFKTDQERGVQLHENHYVNVWYSKGPTYVKVPQVVGLSREDAEQKLKEAGLTVGKVMPEFSNSVPQGNIIRQDVSFKKNVLHDTAVGMTFSDGPKPDYATDTPGDNAPPPNTDTANAAPDATTPTPGTDTAAAPPADTANPNGNATPNGNVNTPDADEQHEFNRKISINRDGKGRRMVRVTYTDSKGMEIEAANAMCEEGEKLDVNFFYYGKEITMKIFYDDVPVWERRFDPQATKGKRIR